MRLNRDQRLHIYDVIAREMHLRENECIMIDNEIYLLTDDIYVMDKGGVVEDGKILQGILSGSLDFEFLDDKEQL